VVLRDRAMVASLFLTVLLTVLYTAVAMTLTTFAAYALNKRRLKGRGFFLLLIVVTMYFTGGLIPDYLLIKDLGLLDTLGSLVIPGALSAYYLIILKTFFADMPDSIEESALMDGANDIQVLFSIVLPLSLPVMATLSLFYAVDRWNRFSDALFYINRPQLYPIQLKLYQIIINSTSLDISAVEGMAQNIIPDGLKAASVMFATIPILCVYPWLQKYFIRGVMIGAIKG
jgi:putative aldouronate transport system permease protein